MSETVFGERVLLFLEHPPLVRGIPARFLAHCTVLADGEPVRAGSVRLEIGALALEAGAPQRDGLFVPEGAPLEAGLHRARLTLASPQAEEVLELGQIRVHADAAAAREAESEDSAAPANEIPFLLEQQWRVKLLLAQAGPRTLTPRLAVPARTRVPEGAEAAVVAPAAGRLLPPEPGRLPRTGDPVEAGALLGWIEPPLAAADVAELHAARLNLELEHLATARADAAARARLAFAERQLARLVELRAAGLGTQPALERAEEDVAVARADSEAARAAQAALLRLQAERAARHPAAEPGAVRLPLYAPIAGTIVAAANVAGESVASDVALFRILDATRLWIEGRVSEFDLPTLRVAPPAFVEFPALPGRRIELSAEAVAGAYVAPAIDPATRTFVVRYELENGAGEFKHGMLARLALATARAEAAVAIPSEAVILDQGQPAVYVMTSGEAFERRELVLGLRDGGFVEVKSGLAAGERVATRGAYLVKLAALSPASFGHGHAH